MVTAPSTLEESNSESWQNSSVCWSCIREVDAKAKSSRQEHDFAHAVKYWMREFPALSSRTRSIIVTSLTSMRDIFLRGALRELFCTSTTIVPELTHEGAILVLDLPIKEYSEVGQLAQVLFKLVWQRACERRDIAQHPRRTFLWADEAQFLSTATDPDFQATARSSRILSVLLTQNIGMFNSQLGREQTNSLMGNLQTKFFHANGDPMTNNWAAELFAKSFQFRGSTGTSTRDGTAGNDRVSRNYGISDSIEFEVLPIEFSRLRKGGPENDWSVEAIVFQGGRIWNGSNKKIILKWLLPSAKLACKLIAVSAEVFCRHSFGMRYGLRLVGSFLLCFGYASLVGLAIPAATSHLLDIYLWIFSLLLLFHIVGLCRQRPPLPHSYSTGQSWQFWQRFGFGQNTVRLVFEPGLHIVAGVIVSPVDNALAVWLESAGVCLFIKEMITLRQEYKHLLDALGCRNN